MMSMRAVDLVTEEFDAVKQTLRDGGMELNDVAADAERARI